MVILKEGICPGLSKEIIEALLAEDVRTVEDLVSSDAEELAQKCSVSYKALVAFRRVLLAQHAAFPVGGADLYDELLNSTSILSTGNPSVDKLLDSGLYTGEITELAGGPGTGKTQLCFSAAVSIVHELKQSVVYICTNGGMRASRLLQMLQARTTRTAEQMDALQRIRVFQVFDVFSLLSCLQNLRAGGLQRSTVGGGSVKAVIVDSVSAVLSYMLGGKQNEGMSLMMQVAAELKMIAKDFNTAVLVTNHVTRDVSGHLKAGLGQSWSHVPRTRLILQRVDRPGAPNGLRTASLTKSSRQLVVSAPPHVKFVIGEVALHSQQLAENQLVLISFCGPIWLEERCVHCLQWLHTRDWMKEQPCHLVEEFTFSQPSGEEPKPVLSGKRKLHPEA